MPKAFEDCVAAGGRVRTVKPNAHTVLPICFIDGKSHAGEPRQVKPKKGKAPKRTGLHNVGRGS